MLRELAGKKLSFRFMILTLVVVAMGMSLFGWMMLRAIESEICNRADAEARTQLNHLLHNLETTDYLSLQAVHSAMNMLLADAHQAGSFESKGFTSLGGKRVPNLYLGTASEVGSVILVDRIQQMTGSNATLFVKSGEDFVRVSTNIKMPDGARATGTILDPAGQALAAIRQGRSYYGLAYILGFPYQTGYEPMRDHAGRLVGIFYVGFPLNSLADLGKHIRECKILEHGFVAVLKPDGEIVFKSDTIDEQGVHNRLARTDSNGWRSVSVSFDKWGYTLSAAYPQSDVSARMRRMRLKTAFSIGFLCFLVVLAQFFLIARLVVSPIQRLVNRMQKAEVTIPRLQTGTNEIGVLGGSFDHLVNKIEERDRQLRQSQANLEGQVASRTSDLLTANRQLKLQAAALEAAANSIVITDLAGTIVWTNPAFSILTGYSAEEAIGKNPRLVKSGKQSMGFYKQMWATISSGGIWRGEIENRRKDGSLYTEEMTITPVVLPSHGICHYVAIKQDITDRKVAAERVQFLAYYDALTSLPNRTLFKDRLHKALAGARRRKEKVAVLFLDLDRFKNINNSLGHSIGDLLLQEIAERLGKWAREQDTVCRVGGDEFLVALTSVKDLGDAAIAAKRILSIMTPQFIIQGHPLNINCSMGISVFPEHGVNGEDLMKNAYAAMYCVKENGGNDFRFFTESMNAQVLERMELENSLRTAIERQELFLVYQPQTDMEAKRIIGFEALLRWRHPKSGLIPPDKFIKIAENTGLIIPIGEWVLRTACLQARRWQREGLPAVPVAVNVSPVQFRQEGFCELVKTILKECDLAPQYLELELTESLLLINVDTTMSTLRELRKLGLKLAIDDFGTGYSSLSYLKQFPISKLKIDRSFIRDIALNSDAAAITIAIINLAKGLNLSVIAEGVENEAQMQFLRLHHCDEIQGYYFGKPMSIAELASMVGRTARPDVPPELATNPS